MQRTTQLFQDLTESLGQEKEKEGGRIGVERDWKDAQREKAVEGLVGGLHVLGGTRRFSEGRRKDSVLYIVNTGDKINNGEGKWGSNVGQSRW